MLGAGVVLIFPRDRIHLKVKVALMAVDSLVVRRIRKRQLRLIDSLTLERRVFKFVSDGKCFEDSSKHYHPFVSLTRAWVAYNALIHTEC